MSQASAKNVPTARDPSIDRFEWAVDSADLGVWDADLLRNQCFYSDGWKRMLGYGSDVLCDDPDLWLQLIHPDDREKAIASGEQHLAGVTEQIETEFRLRHRDGHYIWVLDRGRAVAWDEDGQPTRLIGVQTNITGQKQLMQDLVLQRQRVELALEVGRIGVWQFEPSTGRTIWDRRMRDIYGLDAGPNEVPQATWHQRLHPDDAKAAEHSAARLLQDGMPVDTTYRIVRPSGEIRHVHALTRRVCLNDGSTLLIGSVFDITERVLRENAVLAEKEFLRNSINAIADGVVIVDREQRITYANNAACHLLQHDCTRVLGTLLSDTMLVVHATNLQPILNIASQALALQSSVSGREDACLLRQDGSVLPISDRASAMFDADGFLIGAITIFQDATEQREHQMSLAYAAEHDHLTGLLNRATFDARLDDIVADLADSTAYGLIFIDLDRFKLVNDTAGHAAGDALLQRIAEVLQSCLPDGALAARLGGDEFAAVVSINDVHTLSQICETIIAQINNARPIWSGRSYDIGCSIGAVMLDSIFRDRQSAMAFADAACYAAKSSGRNKSVIHNSSACSVEEDLADVQSAGELLDALRENRIILYAQAIVSLSSSPRVDESFEVLARLRKRDGILLPPSKFIPAAERFGLMVALDRYVIDHCFSLLQHSDHSSGALLSINVSAQSISDPSLLSFVVNGLMRSGIAPARICFEITETAAINSFRAAADFVNGVRALGCRVSLDDFGSGLSSFSYLKNFSVDYLKIDGQFIREIANCEIDSAICRSVADICRNLDISVVAECVEDAASVAILQDIGVGFAQGYHFHRPCSLEGILNSKTGVLGEKSNTALAEQHSLGR